MTSGSLHQIHFPQVTDHRDLVLTEEFGVSKALDPKAQFLIRIARDESIQIEQKSIIELVLHDL